MDARARKEEWEEMGLFLAYCYPELFFTSMSSMYNNPELNPGVLSTDDPE